MNWFRENMKWFVLSLIVLFSGCSLIKATTEITTADGKVYKVVSGSDSLVTFEDGSLKIIANNQGKPSFLETLLGGLIINVPERIESN